MAALWGGYYFAIGNDNFTLATIASSSLDSATKNEYSAELRFLRGYYYFNLIRMFGAVPEVLRKPISPEDANSDIFNVRADTSKIYNDVIIPDLQFAVANLPLKIRSTDRTCNQGSC